MLFIFHYTRHNHRIRSWKHYMKRCFIIWILNNIGLLITYFRRSRNNVVCIASSLRAGRSWVRISTRTSSASSEVQPASYSVAGALYNAKIRNELNYTSILPICLHAVDKVNFTFLYIFVSFALGWHLWPTSAKKLKEHTHSYPYYLSSSVLYKYSSVYCCSYTILKNVSNKGHYKLVLQYVKVIDSNHTTYVHFTSLTIGFARSKLRSPSRWKEKNTHCLPWILRPH